MQRRPEGQALASRPKRRNSQLVASKAKKSQLFNASVGKATWRGMSASSATAHQDGADRQSDCKPQGTHGQRLAIHHQFHRFPRPSPPLMLAQSHGGMQ